MEAEVKYVCPKCNTEGFLAEGLLEHDKDGNVTRSLPKQQHNRYLCRNTDCGFVSSGLKDFVYLTYI